MGSADASLYPLRFGEILRNYAFGDRWIVRAFAKSGLPADHRVAETWEVCDRPNESSRVTNGALAGATLHELIARYTDRLLGHDIVARCGLRFPLLIKFLDASNPLGEQIHPNDTQAATMQRSGDPGKTEAWYMLRVQPGATIRCGNLPGVDRAQLAQALVAGRSRECMREYPVQPDDAFLLYAGTMHYSAGGVLFYEIMQNSDITIGLRPFAAELSSGDKEAAARELAAMVHLEEGFDVHIPPATLATGRNRRTFAFACRYFALERLDLAEEHPMSLDGERFYVLSLIAGSCTLVCGDTVEYFLPGQSCLLPASLETVRLLPKGGASFLMAYVPDLTNNIIRPLRAAGVSNQAIAALGGATGLNEFRPLLPEH